MQERSNNETTRSIILEDGQGKREKGGRRPETEGDEGRGGGSSNKLLRKDNFLCFGDTRPMHDQPTQVFAHKQQATQGHIRPEESSGQNLKTKA